MQTRLHIIKHAYLKIGLLIIFEFLFANFKKKTRKGRSYFFFKPATLQVVKQNVLSTKKPLIAPQLS